MPRSREQPADAHVVGHLGQGPRIGTAAAAAAGTAIVRGFVRVVEARRPVAADHDEPREHVRFRQSDRPQSPFDDVDHLVHRVADVAVVGSGIGLPSVRAAIP